jgi:hypothetical protein
MIGLTCAALLLGMNSSPLQSAADAPRPIPPFATPKNLVTIQGKSFQLVNDRTLGAQIVDPDAPDLWQSIAKQAAVNATKSLPKLKIKLFLYSESLTIARFQGKYIQDRTILIGPEREAYTNAIEQYKTLIRATGFEPEISFTEDDDLLLLTDPAQGPAQIADYVAPNVNDTLFLGDNPSYIGPFDVILALTTAPLAEIWNGPLDESLISIIPLHRVTPNSSDIDLAAYLYHATKWQMTVAPQTNRLAIRTSVFPQTVVPSVDLSWTSNLNPVERTPSPITPLDPSFPLHNLPIDTTAYLLEDRTLALTGNGLTIPQDFALAGSPLPLRDPKRGLDTKGRIWYIYSVESGTTLSSLLKFTAPALQNDPALPQNGDLLPLIKPIGNFQPTQPFAALSPTPNTYTQLGFQATGWLEIISQKANPAVLDPSAKSLEFTVKSSIEEVISVNCYGQDNRFLGSIQITGPKQLSTSAYHRRAFDPNNFQTYHIPLTTIKSPIYRITLGPPPVVIPSSRLLREARQIEFQSIRIVDTKTESITPDEAHSFDTFDPNLPNPQLEEIVKSTSRMNSVAAIGVIADQPVNTQTLLFGELSRDANSAFAFFACKALAQLKTPEAQAELLKTIQYGPFDFNRRVAAMAITDPGTYLDQGNLLFSARSWHTRVQAARLLSLQKTEATQMYLVSSLFDPIANTRGEIARRLDPAFPLSARRLLFLAVNDPSEDIRAICYTQLLTTKDDAILKEALTGIKDESRLVRLAILSRTMATPDEKFRSMYQTAILDKDPTIQALVLKAFSQLPEAVVLGEVSNVVGSKSEPVQLALLQLAQAKSIALPGEELSRLVESPNKSIRDLAQKLKGGVN